MIKISTKFLFSLLLTCGFFCLFSLFAPHHLSFLSAQAADDFTKHFTDVILTQPDGNPLSTSTPISKDADLKIRFDYKIKDSDLLAGEYTFSIPLELAPTSAITAEAYDEDTGTNLIFTLTVETDGSCKVVFTSYAETNDYLDEHTEGWFSILTQVRKDKIKGGLTPIELITGRPDLTTNIIFAIDQITGQGTFPTYAAVPDTSQNLVAWTVTADLSLDKNVFQITGEDNLLTNVVFTIDGFINGLSYDEMGVFTAPTAAKSSDGSPISGATFYYDSSANTLTCTIPSYELDYTGDNKIILSYNTIYDLGAFELSDKAEFTNNITGAFEYPQYKLDQTTGVVTVSTTDASITPATATSFTKQGDATIAANFLAKDSIFNPVNMSITWTVVFNENNYGFSSAINMEDVIPNGLKLLSASLTNNSTAATTVLDVSDPATYTPTGGSYGGGTLTVPITAGNVKHTLVYVTEIDPVIWKTEPSKNFPNSISYIGDGYLFGRTKTAQCAFAGDSGGLIAGAGSYDRSNHTITWTVKANDFKTALTNGQIVVAIPAGLTYVNSSIASALGSGISFDNPGDPRLITINLPDPLALTETITFQTTVDDINLWGTNHHDPGTFKQIDVSLTTAEGIDLSISPKTEVISEVIKKTALGYDYDSKEITWRIDFNQNKMAMSNPVITDNLLAGLTFVSSAGVSGGGGAVVNGTSYVGNTLTVSLDSFSSPPAAIPFITFKTKVADNLLEGAPNSVNNSAEIMYTGLGTAVSSSTSQTVGKKSLAKTGTSNAAFRNYTWTVDINVDQIPLLLNTIVDDLPVGLLLDLESVQLFELTVNSLGGVTPGTTPVYDGANPTAYPDYVATLDGQRFEFTFVNPITQAYRLVFETDNLSTAPASYSNSIQFKGDPSSADSSGSIGQAAAAAGGTSNPKRGSVTLRATEDVGGAPIAGVVFTITGSNPNNVYTVTTDASGLAVFDPIKLDTYTVTQVLPASYSGFGLMAPLPSFTLVAGANGIKNVKYDDTGTIFSLNYHGNGGSGSGYSVENFVSGVSTTVKANPFTRSDGTFLRWNTQADGGGTNYDPSDTILIDSNITLYAIWDVVVSSGSGGSSSGSSGSSSSGSSDSSSSNDNSGSSDHHDSNNNSSSLSRLGDTFPLSYLWGITLTSLFFSLGCSYFIFKRDDFTS